MPVDRDALLQASEAPVVSSALRSISPHNSPSSDVCKGAGTRARSKVMQVSSDLEAMMRLAGSLRDVLPLESCPAMTKRNSCVRCARADSARVRWCSTAVTRPRTQRRLQRLGQSDSAGRNGPRGSRCPARPRRVLRRARPLQRNGARGYGRRGHSNDHAADVARRVLASTGTESAGARLDVPALGRNDPAAL